MTNAREVLRQIAMHFERRGFEVPTLLLPAGDWFRFMLEVRGDGAELQVTGGGDLEPGQFIFNGVKVQIDDRKL